jgi:hypothetical protein
LNPAIQAIHPLPDSACLECGGEIKGTNACHDGSVPRPNETVIACKRCGAVFMLGDGLRLRALTRAERRFTGSIDANPEGAEKARKLFGSLAPLHYYEAKP